MGNETVIAQRRVKKPLVKPEDYIQELEEVLGNAREEIEALKAELAKIPRWIDETKQLPESEEYVLLHVERTEDGKTRNHTFGGAWIPAWTVEYHGDCYETDGFDEDEKENLFYPEGWYAMGFEDGWPYEWFERMHREYKVTHWMPFPQPPKQEKA